MRGVFGNQRHAFEKCPKILSNQLPRCRARFDGRTRPMRLQNHIVERMKARVDTASG